MGTSNFYNKNASKIFVCLENYTDEDTDESVSPEREEIEEFKDYLIEQLNQIENFSFSEAMGTYVDNDTYVGQLYVHRNFMDVDVEISLYVILRMGCYEAANLDYESKVFLNSSEYDTLDEDDFIYLATLEQHNKGLILSNYPKLEKWFEATQTNMIQSLESVFEKVTTPYVRLGTFSNGESVYQKA